MAKGVGNGLKAIGKKIGDILPGMIGAIASFIFKTVGEVIGFLGKNAWLLIVAVVIYLVEQFKKKKRLVNNISAFLSITMITPETRIYLKPPLERIQR